MDAIKRISWVVVLLYVALVGFGFATAVILLGFTGQFQIRKDAPAWVQAVGGLVAILIAVAVPAVQHWLTTRKQQQESKDRARSLGLLLLPAIREWGERNNLIWQHEHPDHDVENLTDNTCVAGELTMKALQIPAIISSRIEQLHALGRAASGVQHAVFNTVSARELVATEEFLRTSGDNIGSVYTDKIIGRKVLFYDLMCGSLKGLTESQHEIEAMFSDTVQAPKPRAR